MHIEMTDNLATVINDVNKILTEHEIKTPDMWQELVWIAINKIYEYHPPKFNVKGCQSGRFCGTGEPNIPASDPNIMSRVQGSGYITKENQ